MLASFIPRAAISLLALLRGQMDATCAGLRQSRMKLARAPGGNGYSSVLQRFRAARSIPIVVTQSVLLVPWIQTWRWLNRLQLVSPPGENASR